jgi:hypothetical protein
MHTFKMYKKDAYFPISSLMLEVSTDTEMRHLKFLWYKCIRIFLIRLKKFSRRVHGDTQRGFLCGSLCPLGFK